MKKGTNRGSHDFPTLHHRHSAPTTRHSSSPHLRSLRCLLLNLPKSVFICANLWTKPARKSLTHGKCQPIPALATRGAQSHHLVAPNPGRRRIRVHMPRQSLTKADLRFNAPHKNKNYQTNPFSQIHNPFTTAALRQHRRLIPPKTNPFCRAEAALAKTDQLSTFYAPMPLDLDGARPCRGRSAALRAAATLAFTKSWKSSIAWCLPNAAGHRPALPFIWAFLGRWKNNSRLSQQERK